MGRLRLTIAKKLLLGYLPLTLLAVLVASFTLVSLTRLNRITDRIVRVDVPLVEAADQLVDHLLAQDSYGRRYLLLRDSALAEVFRQRGEGFRDGLSRFRNIRGVDDAWAAGVEALHREYEGLLAAGFGRPGELPPGAEASLRRKQEEILDAVRRESGDLLRARTARPGRPPRSGLGRFGSRPSCACSGSRWPGVPPPPSPGASPGPCASFGRPRRRSRRGVSTASRNWPPGTNWRTWRGPSRAWRRASSAWNSCASTRAP